MTYADDLAVTATTRSSEELQMRINQTSIKKVKWLKEIGPKHRPSRKGI